MGFTSPLFSSPQRGEDEDEGGFKEDIQKNPS